MRNMEKAGSADRNTRGWALEGWGQRRTDWRDAKSGGKKKGTRGINLSRSHLNSLLKLRTRQPGGRAKG